MTINTTLQLYSANWGKSAILRKDILYTAEKIYLYLHFHINTNLFASLFYISSILADKIIKNIGISSFLRYNAHHAIILIDNSKMQAKTYVQHISRTCRIWFNKNPDIFLNPENQLLMIRTRCANPGLDITYLYY
jgi:hypothetical protein